MKTKLIILSIFVLCLSAAPAMADPILPTAPVTFDADGLGDGSALQTVLDNITVDPTDNTYPYTSFGFDSNVDVLNDAIVDSLDSYWSVDGSGGTINTVIIEIATFAANNKFGVFDMTDPSKQVEIFDGSGAASDQATLSIKADGSVFINGSDNPGLINFAGNAFGYYLDSTADAASGGGFWYSVTSLNNDNMDHMYAYQGNDLDTIAIEDTIPGLSAGDLAPGIFSTNEYILAWEDLKKMGDTGGLISDRDYTDFVVIVESVTPVPVPGAVLLGLLGLSAAGIKLRRFA